MTSRIATASSMSAFAIPRPSLRPDEASMSGPTFSSLVTAATAGQTRKSARPPAFRSCLPLSACPLCPLQGLSSPPTRILITHTRFLATRSRELQSCDNLACLLVYQSVLPRHLFDGQTEPVCPSAGLPRSPCRTVCRDPRTHSPSVSPALAPSLVAICLVGTAVTSPLHLSQRCTYIATCSSAPRQPLEDAGARQQFADEQHWFGLFQPGDALPRPSTANEINS
mmetsp:Transcript_9064/g.20830  ORF Transcript_9064/g.20830 Transcript_9064/m.20830 type:complete len:225 (+) Transcript_9064:92-766(+)